MSKKNVAELLVETLARAGVERIYGVPGDSLNGITDSIRRKRATSLDSCAARGDRSVCRRRGSAPHRPLSGLRRKLRSRQSAFDQWSLRLSSQPRPRPRHCGAGSQQRNWQRLFSGNPPGTSRSRSAATIVNWFPSLSRCRGFWRLPCKPRSSRRGVSVIALPGDVALRDAVEQEPRLIFPSRNRRCVLPMTKSRRWRKFSISRRRSRSLAERAAPERMRS